MRSPRHPLGGALALLVLTAASASAQEAPVPAALEARVRGQVAQRWQVDPERVVLEFGPAPTGVGDSGIGVDVELLGSGGGGHWIARLRTEQREVGGIRVRAGVKTPVVVAVRALSRGHTLSGADLDTAMELRWGEPRRSDPDPGAGAGWVVQRSVRAGEALRRPAVQPPFAVHSGRPVELVWRRAGVGIRTRGRAAGSAALGGEVFVRTESGERLRGVVVAPGVVDVSRGGGEG